MRIHALRHLQFEGLGLIRTWIVKHNHSLTETHFWEEDCQLPDIDDFDFLIIMGGSMNVDQEEQYPWLKREKAFIAKCIQFNKKILGICLGAQLIARSTGKSVIKSPFKEIGWFPIAKNFETHPLFPIFDDRKSVTVMQWHGDMFEIPDGAVSLFNSKGCPNQAFTMNDNRIVGLQFHPELSDQHIRLFFEEESDEFVSSEQYIQLPEIILKESKRHVQSTHKMLDDLLDQMAIL